MNPLTFALVAVWLLLDVLFLVLAHRGSDRLPATVVWGSQLPIVGAAAVALFAPEPTGFVPLWILLGLVNLALAALGLGRQALLAVIGALATAAALVLILLHSFLSLPVIAVAAVFCLGAALFPASDVPAQA